MKIKIVIALFLMSARFHNLNAMGDSKKALEKLAEIAADNKEHGEAQSAAAAAVSLDNTNKKEADIVKAADPVTQALHEAIIKQEHQIKFNAFYKEFQSRVHKFWALCKHEEKAKVVSAYMKAQYETSWIYSIDNLYDKQVAKDADKIQSKIDEHFKKKYAQIYQEVYKQHYNVQAPAVIAARAACLVYDQQNSCCPCTIL
jgi:hypothetical protein